jgi:hypothetical protein
MRVSESLLILLSHPVGEEKCRKLLITLLERRVISEFSAGAWVPYGERETAAGGARKL